MPSWKIKIFNKLPPYLRTKILLSKMPSSFIVEATNACNLRCPACPWHSVMTRKLEFLGLENFKIILSKIERYAKAISFYLMGEPFLNKDIFKIISLCKEKEIKTLISSNAMLVGDLINEILESGLTTLQMTLDGSRPETHEKYRVGSKFEIVVRNIRRLSEERRRRGLKLPVLHIQTLLFKHNKHEVGAIERFAKEIGVDHFSIKAPSVSAGYDDKKRNKFIEEFMLKDADFEKYDRTSGGSDAKFYKNQSFCPQLSHCVALVSGDVVPCCFDYNGTVKFGNLYSQNLEEIWQSEARKNFIQDFFKKKNALCAKCDMLDERGIAVF